MRSGDFTVEIVPRGKGIGVRELDSGHVLARPGQVYALRIRNHGPLRCVAEVRIDGSVVTAGGLVIDAGCTEELERPITPDEDGCFTVVAEGNERVFGADGGRDKEDLGLIEVRFRRELPDGDRPRPLPKAPADQLDLGRESLLPDMPARLTPRLSERMALGRGDGSRVPNDGVIMARMNRLSSAFLGQTESPALPEPPQLEEFERAAGTGLTGHSTQQFRPTQLGPLESEATVVRLRLVVASEEDIRSAPARRDNHAAPARPLARP
jgi:hypothetical protein